MTTPAAAGTTTPAAAITPPPGTPPAAGDGAAPPPGGTPPGTPAASAEGAVTQTEATTTKPDAAGKPADGVPADVEVKLPEGVQADKALLDNFKAWAKELKVGSEGAQKLADIYVKAQEANAQAADAAFAAQVKEWEAAVKADADFGGARFEASKALAAKTMAKFGGPELVEMLETSKLGSHPLFFKFFAAVGKAVGEDSIGGTTGGTPAQSRTDEDMQKLWYPKTFEQKAGK